MSSNGFLLSLDLRTCRLPGRPWLGLPRLRGDVSRVVLHPTGDWTVFTRDGRRFDGRLSGGWVLAGGALIGLAWRTADRGRLAALTSLRLLDEDTGRRLLVRLRWPATR